MLTVLFLLNVCACTSLVPSSLSRTRREGVWPNVYRARVARATYSARQSDARIKSHDCAGMNGMHINDCARVRSYAIVPLVPNGMLIYSHFLFTHTRNIHDVIHCSVTRALYTFGQTPSLRMRERGLGTRLCMYILQEVTHTMYIHVRAINNSRPSAIFRAENSLEWP